MVQSWLTNLAPIDLIAASVDIVLGLAAAIWATILTMRAIHNRRQDGPSK